MKTHRPNDKHPWKTLCGLLSRNYKTSWSIDNVDCMRCRHLMKIGHIVRAGRKRREAV